MTTALTTTNLVNQGQVDQALQFLTRRLKSRDVERNRHELEEILAELTVPCRPDWLMSRIAVLLDPYFDKGTPHAVRVASFEDWADELAKFPEWAIDRAVKWWKSRDNPKRRQRPFEGDISLQACKEMDAVNAMRKTLKGRLQKPLEQPKPRAAPTQEEKERMSAYVDNFFKSAKKK